MAGLAGTWANTGLPPGANLTSPSDGTIVRWRIVGATGGPFRLRVLTPVGGITYTGAGTGPPQTPTTNATETFPANLPIKAGQIVGYDNTNNSDTIAFRTATGATYTDWNPALADGDTLPVYEPLRRQRRGRLQRRRPLLHRPGADRQEDRRRQAGADRR